MDDLEIVPDGGINMPGGKESVTRSNKVSLFLRSYIKEGLLGSRLVIPFVEMSLPRILICSK